MLKHYTTPTGLTILVQEMPHTYSVALSYLLNVGARHELPAQSGISHLIEHMCFKGTRRFPTAQLLAGAVEGGGGYLDAATSYEQTTYWAKVAQPYLEQAFAVLTDLVRFPLFDPRELEKERQVVIEELRGTQDSPDEWVHTLLQQSVWGPAQPLGRDVGGSIESVAALRRADLVQFWQQHYAAAPLVLSVAGNVQAEQIVALATAAFADLPLQPRIAPIPTTPALPGRTLYAVKRNSEQAHFCLGFPAMSYHADQRWALELLDTYMGGGMSSRLFVALREEHGLAYDVGTYYSKYADTGLWVIYASVDPRRLAEATAVTLEVIQRIAEAGIPDADLHRTREQIKGGILLSLEDTWSVAGRNGGSFMRYGSVTPLEQIMAELDAVTPADVQQVLQQVVQPAAMHLAVIGPGKQLKRTQQLLEEFTV